MDRKRNEMDRKRNERIHMVYYGGLWPVELI